MNIFNHLLSVSPVMADVPPDVTQTIGNFLTGIQAIGGTVAAVMIGLAAFHFIKGGKEDFLIGKSKIVGIVIGLAMLILASSLKTWVTGMISS